MHCYQLSHTLYIWNIAEYFKLALFSMKNMYTNINITVIHSSYPVTVVSGVCGGSASGKTTVARKIIEALDVPWVSLLSLDSFYKVRFPWVSLLSLDSFYKVRFPWVSLLSLDSFYKVRFPWVSLLSLDSFYKVRFPWVSLLSLDSFYKVRFRTSADKLGDLCLWNMEVVETENSYKCVWNWMLMYNWAFQDACTVNVQEGGGTKHNPFSLVCCGLY